MGRAILFILMVALMLYALVDCIRTPRDMMPAKLPKALWLLVIMLFSPIGPIAWIIVSRVTAAEEKGGRFEPTVWSSKDSVQVRFGKEKPAAPQTPDDDPEFLESLEQRIRDKRREEYQRQQREAEEEQFRGHRQGETREGGAAGDFNANPHPGKTNPNPHGEYPDSEHPTEPDDATATGENPDRPEDPEQ
ncbi:hypothetical protein HMPREF9278_0316 [Mobiluncus mulieris FB024-16]|uniref:PLD nuclease N-terminal domain-containing protein n=1 Tax=Mobiluncus mulieris TaxID=2052 RepID=UPI0001E517E3|nr:PLD nuclease N-terminal domain-containing protein [Mobiluncus mulieris]EFN92754.1 hypothetical protein HMPREF9278_0316 [Mobiluncus mulieris FB024-16]MCU9996582.1 PLDc_N domain-containing protein [Mobiluncus mulieris]